MRIFRLLLIAALVCLPLALPISADPVNVENPVTAALDQVLDALGDLAEWIFTDDSDESVEPESADGSEDEDGGLPGFGPGISPGG